VLARCRLFQAVPQVLPAARQVQERQVQERLEVRLLPLLVARQMPEPLRVWLERLRALVRQPEAQVERVDCVYDGTRHAD
jgi:hypothetical protein